MTDTTKALEEPVLLHGETGKGVSGRTDLFAQPLCAPRTRQDVHYSSASDEWATPPGTFYALDREFRFTLDAAATAQNAKCARYFTRADDGLAQDWGRERVWLNPPYGRAIGAWMRKAHEASRAGALVVCLVPARTDTEWWHAYAMPHEVRFIRGRLKFGGSPKGAPFPSAVVIMQPSLFA